MASGKAIDVPINLFIQDVFGKMDFSKMRVRANQFPERDSREAYVRDNEYYRYYRGIHQSLRKLMDYDMTRILTTPEQVELKKILSENRKLVRESKERSDIINAQTAEMRARERKELEEIKHRNRMEFLTAKENYIANRSPFLSKVGLSMRDLKNIKDYGKKNFPLQNWDFTLKKLKNIGIGAAISGATLLAKKTFTTLLSTSKKIVKVFQSALTQAETFKNLMNLLFAPLVTMFTLLLVPVLLAAVPLIKTMFKWVVDNKDAIMNVGSKLAEVFNADLLNIVGKALDGILLVVDALANIFATNAAMIDTSSLDRFISSTVLAVTNMIQDILMSIVAFCYSPEGQAFIKSVSYSVGEIIASIFTTLIALIPVMIESLIYSLLGIINGLWSVVSKAVFNFFDVIDGFFGNAISGFLNTIVNLVNSAINGLNSINIFGFSPFNIPNINGGSVGQIGSSVSNFADQSIVNNFNINNHMSMTAYGAIKEVMSTGVY